MEALRPLSATARYRQAVQKARLIGNRNLRKFLAGEIHLLPQTDERGAIIAEFDRLIRVLGVSPTKSEGET